MVHSITLLSIISKVGGSDAALPDAALSDATLSDAILSDAILSDEQMDQLGVLLARRWQAASTYRRPPDFWLWESLVSEGVIQLDGAVAFVEIDLPDTESQRQAVRHVLLEWLATLRRAEGLRVFCVWARQTIEIKTETLHRGASSEVKHDRKDKGAPRKDKGASQGDEGQGGG